MNQPLRLKPTVRLLIMKRLRKIREPIQYVATELVNSLSPSRFNCCTRCSSNARIDYTNTCNYYPPPRVSLSAMFPRTRPYTNRAAACTDDYNGRSSRASSWRERAPSRIVSRARRILRAHVYCARRKEGRGKNTSGVFGQVFVCTAGMLAVAIRLQYR